MLFNQNSYIPNQFTPLHYIYTIYILLLLNKDRKESYETYFMWCLSEVQAIGPDQTCIHMKSRHLIGRAAYDSLLSEFFYFTSSTYTCTQLAFVLTF
jgi:hypothetical protein